MARRTTFTAALWLLLAVPAASLAADATGNAARSDRSKATNDAASRAGQQKEAGGPQSPARKSVAEDLHDGQRQCEELSGKERAACDARAAATAETPRGREGANPTGSSKPAGSSGSSR